MFQFLLVPVYVVLYDEMFLQDDATMDSNKYQQSPHHSTTPKPESDTTNTLSKVEMGDILLLKPSHLDDQR